MALEPYRGALLLEGGTDYKKGMASGLIMGVVFIVQAILMILLIELPIWLDYMLVILGITGAVSIVVSLRHNKFMVYERGIAPRWKRTGDIFKTVFLEFDSMKRVVFKSKEFLGNRMRIIEIEMDDGRRYLLSDLAVGPPFDEAFKILGERVKTERFDGGEEVWKSPGAGVERAEAPSPIKTGEGGPSESGSHKGQCNRPLTKGVLVYTGKAEKGSLMVRLLLIIASAVLLFFLVGLMAALFEIEEGGLAVLILTGITIIALFGIPLYFALKYYKKLSRPSNLVSVFSNGIQLSSSITRSGDIFIDFSNLDEAILRRRRDLSGRVEREELALDLKDGRKYAIRQGDLDTLANVLGRYIKIAQLDL